MKTKSLFSILLAICCCFILVGCTNNGRNVKTKAITMNTYFSETVKVNNSSSDTYNLSAFTSDNVDTNTLLTDNKKLTFTGVSNWIYGMYIECVYFYLYTTKSVEINSLKITMTDLDSGEEDSTLPEGTYKLEETFAVIADKQQGKLIRIDINKTALNQTLTLTIDLSGEPMVASGDYNWTIYGLTVYGEHR